MARRPSLLKRLREIADRFEPSLANAFLRAIDELRSEARLSDIVRQLENGDIEGALRAINLDPAAFSDLIETMRQGYSAGGSESAGDIPRLTLPSGQSVVVRFNMRSPRAELWLTEESSDLVTRIIEDQRNAIRSTLRAGLEDGRNPRNVGLDVVGRIDRASNRRVGGIIGLTDPQAAFVVNARRELASGDPATMRTFLSRERRDRRFDRIISAAIREGRPIPAGDIDKIVGRYADRLLQLRGETVARTEMLASLNAATGEAYEQAIDTGAIQRENVTKTWRTAADSRVRDSHGAINGAKVGVDDRFPNGLLYPHQRGAPASEVVNCRCIAVRSIDFLAGLEETAPPTPPPAPPVPSFVPRTFTPARSIREASDLAVDLKVSKFRPEWPSTAKLSAVNEAIRASVDVDDRFDLPPVQAQGQGSWIAKMVAAAGGRRLSVTSQAGAWWWGPGKALGWNPKALQEPDVVIRNFGGTLTADKIAPGRAAAVERVREGPGKEAARRFEDYGWLASRKADTRYLAMHEHGHRFHSSFPNEVNATLAGWNKDGWSLALSKYGGTNADEFVAESFALYMTAPDQHWRIKPELLALFRAKDKSLR